MNTAIHVVLDTSSVEGLSCSGPASQVIPPGSMGKFQLVLRSHVVQPVSEQIQYCINGCHIQSLDILADVVAVTLDLSSEELVFAFGLENWDDYVEQVRFCQQQKTQGSRYVPQQSLLFPACPTTCVGSAHAPVRGVNIQVHRQKSAVCLCSLSCRL